MDQAILDINNMIRINELRSKLEVAMNQVEILNQSRSDLQTRLQLAVKSHLHTVVSMYELQVSTTTSVLDVYRRYMMDTWHELEGIEDQLLDHGVDEDAAELIVWGQD